MKKNLIFPIFILVFAIFLTSCGNPVSFTVEKEHEAKIKVIYKMISGLVESDSKLYLSSFEPKYIENVKNVVDTLGTQYFDAKDFDDLINTFFFQNKQNQEANYGKDLKVKITFDSVNEISKDQLGGFVDDYSVGYKLPIDDIQTIVKASTVLSITSSNYSGETKGSFTLLQMTNGDWYLHPESFLYAF